MRLSPKLLRRWIRVPRWPSTDYRDYLTGGDRRSPAPPAITRSQGMQWPGGLPALSEVVGVRRADAVVHVELRASPVSAGSPRTVREPAGAARVDGAPDPPVVLGDGGSTWTLTLPLN